MITKQVEVSNKHGIHARPASMIVKTAAQFSSNIHVISGEERVNAKSILGIIALGAGHKTILTIVAEGQDEEQAVTSLIQLFEKKFEL